MTPLIDSFGRPVTNLRVSLTPKCNLRCIYCHREGEDDPKTILSKDEITDVINTAVDFGVRSVKFTGGEPLMRRDATDIIRMVPPGIESSMTTNGTLLAGMANDLKDAGLSRVNVSLDSLKPERYKQITGSDLLEKTQDGISAAIDAGLTPVKINMVLLKGINEDEVGDFMDYVRNNRDLILQIIELMEFNDCSYHGDVKGVENELDQHAKTIITRRMHHRKKYCMDGAEVEVVHPLHNTEFCSFCNRLRLTSDGFLKPCLLRNDNLVDIRGCSGEELKDRFRLAVSKREPYFR